MAKELQAWLAEDVGEVKERPVAWLSQYYFFRDPIRAAHSDLSYFYSPADGIILYPREVEPGDPLLEIKGKPYSLKAALRDEDYDKRSLVIGVFMTFYDVHVNRVPYPGRLSYRLLDPIDTLNHPMLDVEAGILEELRLPLEAADYLHQNQRMVNRIDSVQIGQSYYVLQIADYDVDSIMPFELKQNWPSYQGQRFSQIRYGSQVDLIIPVSDLFDFEPLHSPGVHVEAGIDPLVAVRSKRAREQ